MMMPSIISNRFFDDLFDDFARPARNIVKFRTPQNLSMKTDIKESESGYDLSVDLPGYSKEDITASLNDGYLTISASSSDESEDKDDNGFIRKERYFGSCSRSFYVGDSITEDDINAEYKNGVLFLNIPKKEVIPQKEEKKLISIK